MIPEDKLNHLLSYYDVELAGITLEQIVAIATLATKDIPALIAEIRRLHLELKRSKMGEQGPYDIAVFGE